MSCGRAWAEEQEDRKFVASLEAARASASRHVMEPESLEDVSVDQLLEMDTPPVRHVDPKAAYGATKPSVAIIPGILEVVAALAAEDGAKKYGAYNYREGHPVEVMTYANAAKRHLQAWIDGEDFTSDTGVPNLGGVIMCVGIILDIMSTGVAVDNRPPKGRTSEMQDAGKAWKKAVDAGENPVEAAKRILGPAMGVKS